MPASSILNRMEKGEIVSMKDKMASLNSFIHHQKTNLTLVTENIEVLSTYRKREKISLLKGSVESLIERQKIMNDVAMVIMEEAENESQNYKKAEGECAKFDDAIKTATKDVDKLIDEVEKELDAKENTGDNQNVRTQGPHSTILTQRIQLPKLKIEFSVVEVERWLETARFYLKSYELDKMDVPSQQSHFFNHVDLVIEDSVRGKITDTSSFTDILEIVKSIFLEVYPLMTRRWKVFDTRQKEDESYVVFKSRLRQLFTEAKMSELDSTDLFLMLLIKGLLPGRLKTKVSVLTKIDEKILDDNAREDQLRGRVDELSSNDQHMSRYAVHNTTKVCHKCCSPDHFERDCQWTYPCHDCKEAHKAGSALCRYSSNNRSKSTPSYRGRGNPMGRNRSQGRWRGSYNQRRSRSRGRGSYNQRQNGYFRSNQRNQGYFRGNYRGNARQILHEDGGQNYGQYEEGQFDNSGYSDNGGWHGGYDVSDWNNSNEWGGSQNGDGYADSVDGSMDGSVSSQQGTHQAYSVKVEGFDEHVIENDEINWRQKEEYEDEIDIGLYDCENKHVTEHVSSMTSTEN